MSSDTAVFLNSMGLVSPLGCQHEDVLRRLLLGESGLVMESGWLETRDAVVGRASYNRMSSGSSIEFGSLGNSKVNNMLLAALDPIMKPVQDAIQRYGADRVGLVLGTSTSGILESEVGLKQWAKSCSLPADYRYQRQELGNISEFLAHYLGITGPAYSLSTACTSSAKALAAGRRLLLSGLCDAVIVGGADTLCQLTMRGFAALDSMSVGYCSPFGVNRDGINIGEAAVLFLMSREPAKVALSGAGETSDAYHISAPDPSGSGALSAMTHALSEAGNPSLDYLNLHGTATRYNDAMESLAVYERFSDGLAVSSTKGLTGHTLGAAGALEAAFCWLLLSDLNQERGLPANIMSGQVDNELPPIGLLRETGRYQQRGENWMMSNSFAFGGNNIALLFRGES